MRYDLFPALFARIEDEIERGLYEQARSRLNGIGTGSLSSEQNTVHSILCADVYSRTGRFQEALNIQKRLLDTGAETGPVRAFIHLSHAYTCGYTGDIDTARYHFKRCRSCARTAGIASLPYYASLGEYDILFHDYNYDRFCYDDNKTLIKQITATASEAARDSLLSDEDRRVITGQLCFRRAVLLWLSGKYAQARNDFRYACDTLSMFFHVWALFGLVYCAHMLSSPDKQILQKKLSAAVKRSAWRENAKKYWPVALLAGRTMQVTGRPDKAQNFYREILLNVRTGYANHSPGSARYARYLTAYFYPVYREAVHHLLQVQRSYRYALNRAEMFRGRFLSEQYKRCAGTEAVRKNLTPNIRIDHIGETIGRRFGGDVSLLYCFDFTCEATLLLSRDAARTFRRIHIPQSRYEKIFRVCEQPCLRQSDIDTLSELLADVTGAVKTGNLLVIPHGMFNHVPFQGLYRQGRPLGADVSVSCWPSLQMAVLGEKPERSAGGRFLFIGTRSDSASVGEIEPLSGLVPDAVTVFDPDAGQLAELLSGGCSCAHITAHGAVRRDGCSTSVRFQDSEIDLADVITQCGEVPPALMLNVCYGGFMQHSTEDMILGLPVSLFQKGMRCALVHTRQAPQEQTGRFFETVYTKLHNGHSIGDACRKAAAELPEAGAAFPRLMGNSLLRVF